MDPTIRSAPGICEERTYEQSVPPCSFIQYVSVRFATERRPDVPILHRQSRPRPSTSSSCESYLKRFNFG